MRLLILAVALAGGAMAGSSAPEAMLRAAMDKESVDGDLKAAIEQYKKIVANKGASREVVAKALVRLGACYERQGDAEARKAYERVVREFGDQADSVRQAQARLAAGRPPAISGIAVRRVWDRPGHVDGGSISPDGRYFAYSDWGNGDLAVRDLSTGEDRLVTHMPVGNSDGVEGPLWSHDGKRIAHSFENPDWHIRVVNVDGTGMRTLYNSTKSERWAYAVSWSPDDKRILAEVLQRDGAVRLFWITLSDGSVSPIPAPAVAGGVKLSPDGRYIAFGSNRNKGRSNVRLMSADGSGETWLTEHSAEESPVGWSPDGKHVLFASRRAGSLGLWAQTVANGKPQGSPVLIQRDMGGHGWHATGVTRAGVFYYVLRTSAGDIYTASMDPATGKVTSVPMPVPTSRNGSNGSPRWSPDSRRLLYVWGSATIYQLRYIRKELSVYSFDTQKDQPVAPRENFTGSVKCWSGDGASILFSRFNAGNSEPVKFNLNNSEAMPLFQKATGWDWGNCNDRLMAYFTGHPHGPETINVRSIPEGVERTIYKFPSQPYAGLAFPQISHDSRNVAFFAHVDGPAGTCSSQNCWGALLVVPADGGPAKELVRAKTPSGFQRYGGVTWSPDDRYLYFLKRDDEKAPYEMFRVPADGGQVESTGLKRSELREIDIAPDGRHVAFAIGALDKPELWAMENFLPPPAK